MMKRRGATLIDCIIAILALTVIVAAGQPRRVKAEPVIIYPVSPIEQGDLTGFTTHTNNLINKTAKSILWHSERSGREIYGTGRTGEASASNRGGYVGDSERTDEGLILAEENADDLGADSYMAEKADWQDVSEWVYYGNCRITHYDDCELCCGVAGNATASGVYPTPQHTVATGADLPFGTELLINGQVYVVEDRGVDEYQVDIFVPTHDEAAARGLYYADVFMRYPE